MSLASRGVLEAFPPKAEMNSIMGVPLSKTRSAFTLLVFSIAFYYGPVWAKARGSTQVPTATTSPLLNAHEVSDLNSACPPNGALSMQRPQHSCMKSGANSQARSNHLTVAAAAPMSGAGVPATAADPAPTRVSDDGTSQKTPPLGSETPAWKLDSTQLRSLSNWDLCTGYAAGLSARRSTATLETEIRRRRLGCAGSVRPVADAPVRDYPVQRQPAQSQPPQNRGVQNRVTQDQTAGACSGLRVLSISQVQRGTIFTVANTNSQPKAFRIHYRGIQSSRFRIPAATTQGFGVAVSSAIGAIAAAGAQARGETDELINDCY